MIISQPYRGPNPLIDESFITLVKAYSDLGRLYTEGEGGQFVDINKALQNYDKAYEYGDLKALVAMGDIYFDLLSKDKENQGYFGSTFKAYSIVFNCGDDDVRAEVLSKLETLKQNENFMLMLLQTVKIVEPKKEYDGEESDISDLSGDSYEPKP